MSNSSQKFIERNRPPMVHIEYEVERYGAKKKVEVPFVMGVMSDLSGASKDQLPPVAERKFYEIDNETFDTRLKAQKPSVQFTVPNRITGEGNLAINMTFESLDDFSPAAIASKADGPIKALYELRQKVNNLKNRLDGKAKAEELIAALVQNKALLTEIADDAKSGEAAEEAGDASEAEAQAEDGTELSQEKPK